jgi:hypothetical protein
MIAAGATATTTVATTEIGTIAIVTKGWSPGNVRQGPARPSRRP